jgi:hypothetical protein
MLTCDLVTDLIAKVSYNAKHDHLIVAGDMISKGPSSPEVIELLISMQASCVRGNHEDRILLTYREMKSRGSIATQTSNADKRESMDQELARSFTKKQIQYLASCPVILKLGRIPGMGETMVVHAGLVPGVGLEKQDPVSVMNMRTLDLETRVPSRSTKGKAWNKVGSFFTYTSFSSLSKLYRIV